MVRGLFLTVVLIALVTGCRTKNARTQAAPTAPTPTTQFASERPSPCDDNLLVDSQDPLDAASAMDACNGVIAASWTLPDGSRIATNPATDVTHDASFHLGHGLLTNFGTAPRAGERMLAISTGAARARTDSGFSNPTVGLSKNYEHALANLIGFPSLGDKAFAGSDCVAPSATAADGIALNVVFSAPMSAKGFSFDYRYFTSDFTFSICSEFADQAAAMLGKENILRTSLGNDLNSNTRDLDACTPTDPYACSLGTDSLQNTGYVSGAATGWKTTTPIPISPGRFFTLRFVIWDSADGLSDSTLLIDNFRWF